jgi:hypothetical protein
MVRKMFYLKYWHHNILQDLGRLNASKVQNLKYSIFEHQDNIFPVAFFFFIIDCNSADKKHLRKSPKKFDK